MEKKTGTSKLIVLFIAIVYVISAVGYFMWFSSGDASSPYILVVGFSPAIAAGVIILKSRNKVNLTLRSFIVKDVLWFTAIPIIYFAAAYIIYCIYSRSMVPIRIESKEFVMLIITYIFEAILEEMGWRGVLLPLMKDRFSFKKAVIINGLVWSVWHYPMIIARTMLSYNNVIEGLFFFTVEAVLITAIMAVLLLDFKKNCIWPFVFYHAAHNLMGDVIGKSVSTTANNLIGEAGIILTFFVLITAVLVWSLRKRKNDSLQGW